MKYTHFTFGENSVPAEVCRELIQRYSSHVVPAVVGEESEETRDIRRSNVCFSNDQDVLNLVSRMLMESNRSAFGFDVSGYVEAQFAQYKGTDFGHYDWHIDSFLSGSGTMFDRKLTLIIMLSDPSEYEGGDLYLDKYSGEPVKLTRGAAVAFPSFRIHKVTPVTKGTRNVIVGWMQGPHWR